MMKLTAPQRRALEILREFGGLHARAFALHMWPDSKGWTTRCRRRGSNTNGAIGAAMWMKGGTFLRRLERRGLVREVGGAFELTRSGKEHLDVTAAENVIDLMAELQTSLAKNRRRA